MKGESLLRKRLGNPGYDGSNPGYDWVILKTIKLLGTRLGNRRRDFVILHTIG